MPKGCHGKEAATEQSAQGCFGNETAFLIEKETEGLFPYSFFQGIRIFLLDGWLLLIGFCAFSRMQRHLFQRAYHACVQKHKMGRHGLSAVS